MFERYAPTWPKSPVGIIGRLWRDDATPSALKLIDVAQVLFLVSRAITLESAEVFAHKVRSLLNCRGEAQYDELLAELRVGALLAVRAGPVACEPLARPFDPRAAAQPSSPDYGIRLPGGDIVVEVTTLRIGLLDSWERAIEIVRHKIADAAVSANLAKEVEIHAPLRIRSDALNRNEVFRLLAAMKADPSGSMEVPLGPVTSTVMWRGIPLIELPTHSKPSSSLPSNPFPTDQHFSAVIGSATQVQSASASKVVLVLGPDVEQLFVRSIRNTLDGKRAQMQYEAPTLLVLQPGAWRVSGDYVRHLIDKRIWPNRDYAWLTGIGLLQSRRTFTRSESDTTLTVSWNGQPKIPRTAALTALIEQEAWFSRGLPAEAPQTSSGDA